jgi:hypothetical protein
VVRQSAPGPHQFLAIRSPNEAIQQTVSMNVAGFFPMKKETDPAETMPTNPHARPPPNLSFNLTYPS